MAHAMALESQRLAEDLYSLIQLLDPANWRAELEIAARERVGAIKARLAALLEQGVETDLQPLQESLRAVAAVVDEATRQRDWSALFSRLQPVYEGVAVRLRTLQVEVPDLRPTNWKRSAVHATNGLVSLACLEFFMSRPAIQWLTIALLTWVVVAETTRRYIPAVNAALMRFFAPIAHPHESHRMNSASWYGIALFILAFTSSTMACSLAVIVLGIADPAAAIIGRRYGSIKLRAGRSLEGSLTFVLVGFVVSLAVLATLYAHLPVGAAVVIALAASVSGAVAEVFSSRWLDDNLTIPVVVAAAVSLMSFVLL